MYEYFEDRKSFLDGKDQQFVNLSKNMSLEHGDI